MKKKTTFNAQEFLILLGDLSGQVTDVALTDFSGATSEELERIQRLFMLMTRDAATAVTGLLTPIKIAKSDEQFKGGK